MEERKEGKKEERKRGRGREVVKKTDEGEEMQESRRE